jgi:GAF domain-containing protein
MSKNKPSNPTHANTKSPEKQTSGLKLSIQTKITLWAGLCLAAVSLILIGYSVVSLRQAAIGNSEREAAAIAEAKAGFVKNQLDSPLIAARTLARSLGSIKDMGFPTTLSRDQVNAMLRRVLIDNPSLLGTYTSWEPDAFDGLDAQYVGGVAHDGTGRFIPYWVRDADGIIHTEALTGYETAGIGDWYIVPRQTKKETTLAPILSTIQGQDVIMASFVVPIVVNDTFYGIAGVDESIGYVQQLVDNIDLYEGSTNAVLFTDAGALIAVRQKPELVNQPANLIYEDFDEIQPQFGSSFSRLSPDGKYLQIFSPIDVGSEDTHWVMGLIIPFEKITAPATTAAIRQVTIGAVLTVLALILLWILAGQVVRPLQILTSAATAVSQGDWTVKAIVHSNDEAEVLANAFNTMTSELQSVFGTLEQRVADRTKALATSTDVSRRLSTILDRGQLVTEVVNQVNSAFGYYHTQVYFFDENGENLVMSGGSGEAGKLMLAQFHKVMWGRGLVGRAAESNAPVLVTNTTQNPEWLPNPLLPDTKSEMAIPISIGDQVLGVLDIQQNVVDGLQQEDVDSLQSIANQIAVALQNIRQYENTQKIAADMGVVATVGIATSTITEAGQLLQEVVDLSKKSFNLYHAHIYLMNDAENVLALTAGAGEVGRQMVSEKRSIPLDSEQSLVARAARTREGVVVNDVTVAPDFLPNPLLPDTRSEMAVPMIVAGKVIGVLDVQSEIANRFTGVDVSIKTTLASQVAVALQNARTFSQSKQQAQREAAVNTITQKIQSTTSVEAALQMAARELGHALGMKSTLVTLEPEAPSQTTQITSTDPLSSLSKESGTMETGVS